MFQKKKETAETNKAKVEEKKEERGSQFAVSSIDFVFRRAWGRTKR